MKLIQTLLHYKSKIEPIPIVKQIDLVSDSFVLVITHIINKTKQLIKKF